MSEDTTTTEGDASDGAAESEDVHWKAEAEKWKALARKHESRAKDLATPAAEAEKAAARAAAAEGALSTAERRAADLELSILRQQVARDKKLPVYLADRLSGTDLAELEKDADSILAHMVGTTNPLRQGAANYTGTRNMNQIIRSLAGR